jgi:hypothetical protein
MNDVVLVIGIIFAIMGVWFMHLVIRRICEEYYLNWKDDFSGIVSLYFLGVGPGVIAIIAFLIDLLK